MCLNEYFELNLLFAINEWPNNFRKAKSERRLGDGLDTVELVE